MSAPAAPLDVLTRDQVPVEETWDLGRLYPDDAAWEADAARAPQAIATAAAHRRHLGASPMALLVALDDVMAARQLLERLFVYAHLRRDEDTTDPARLARYERAVALSIQAGEALAFVRPEILGLPEGRLAVLATDPVLRRYRHLLHDLQRHRAHTRSVEVEEVLAQTADLTRAPRDAFGALDNADLATYGTVRDETGAEVVLTKARYGRLIESRDREVRRSAYATIGAAYVAHQHTLTALYGAAVRADAAHARVRHYPSARAAALFADNLPESVYDSLIAAVRAARPAITRSLELRRRVLGVAELASYDLRVPLAAEPPRTYGYWEAVDLVLAGLAPLGPRYVDDLRAGFDARWVDVHETRGKRGGAYSSGAYGAPPVILMNWNGTLRDVFTLAHEAGHAMHTFYANAAQPYHDARYPIFLAEIASTVNEVLLLWHLLDQTPADDRAGRFALLDRFAEMVDATLITQTHYAEFEQRTHALAEADRPLTLAALSGIWTELQADYHPGLALEASDPVRWGRIPHFYRAFYVYQYATGLSAAITLARAIRDEGEPAAERYLALLRAGGSDYPLDLLRRAGVDLATPQPVETALAEFARTVEEMEALVDAGAVG